MISEDVVAEIRNYFAQRNEVVAVYLFGSTAKNRETKKSDLDLAVLFSDGIDQYERFQEKLQIANDLETNIGTKIDIVDLRSAELFFVHQAMKEKILLYERDLSSRVYFEVMARKYYFDHILTYQQYHRQARKRLREREG